MSANGRNLTSGFDPLLSFDAAESSPSTPARMRLFNGLLEP